MKQILTIISSFFTLLVFGQNLVFEEIKTNPSIAHADLINLMNSATLLVDIDNDLDLDLLMVGDKNDDIYTYEPVSVLYINTGHGNFSEVINTPFVGVHNGSTAFSDIDNDGDFDLIITGTDVNGNAVTKLYTNDGAGNFAEVVTSSVIDVTYSAVAFSDVDNDLDDDLFITGENDLGVKISKLYLNDGFGNFNESLDSTFSPITRGDIKFADLNNDGIDDLLISGKTNSQVIDGYFVSRITKIYFNDGSGVFTQDTISDFSGFENCSLDIGDVDGDNDLDVVISGLVGFNNQTKLYVNYGNGYFSEDLSVQLYNCSMGDIAFLDMDNDSDLDIALTGENDGSEHSKLFSNDGNGNFVEVVNTDIIGLGRSTLAVGDIDNDGDIDILFTGYFDIGFGTTNTSNFYSNNGLGDFKLIPNFYLIGGGGASGFADIDGDNDLDLLILDYSTFESPERTGLYLNDGAGNFVEVLGTPFENLRYGNVEFADVDNDGDVDLLISGETNSNNASTKLYLNDGIGNFSESSNNFYQLTNSNSKFADIDNDNDLDLLMTGSTTNDVSGTRLYKNDGFGNFTYMSGTGFTDVQNGDIAFSDVDNDNDLDVVITGNVSILTNTYVGELYLNDGTGNYTYSSPVGGALGGVAFADIDNDNDEDLIVTGGVSDAKLYKNDGLGNFTLVLNTQFPPSNESPVFVDLDKDNDVDLILSGTNDFTRIYINDGIGNFTYYSTNLFDSLNRHIYIADIDNDSDIDLLVHGLTNSDRTSKLFRNLFCNNPTTYINVSEASICDTDSSLLFVDPMYQTYLWSNGDTTNSIYVSDMDNYSVLLSTNNSCQVFSNTIAINSFDCTLFIDSLYQTVDDCLLDTVSIVMAFVDNVTFLNDSIHVVWNFVTDDGNVLFATASYFIELNGVYSVSIEMNCNGKKTLGVIYYDLIIVDFLSAKENILANLEFVVYPNPTSGKVKIDLRNSYNTVLVEIVSLNGKVLQMATFENSDDIFLSISNLESSIYIIKITADGIQLPIAKLLKE